MIDYIDENAEGAVILSDLDDAIIGVVEEFGNGPRILYSTEKIIQILIDRDCMSEEEAVEYYGFNIVGMFAGEQNPVFLVKEFEKKNKIND